MDMHLDTPSQLEKWSSQIPVAMGIRHYWSKVSTRQLWRVFLLVNIWLAFIYLITNLLFSWQWINRPFAGFMHQNRVVSHSHLPGWETAEDKIGAIHLAEGDVIMAVDNTPLVSSEWLIEYARQKTLGYPLNYTLQTAHHNTIVNTTIPVVQFTTQNFIQLVVIPTFISFISLIIAGSVAYLRAYKLPARMFVFFTLALVYFLVSFPEFITGNYYIVTYTLSFLGKIVAPIFLLHFLLVFPRPRKVLQDRPFLLPLIYLPVLPGLIHISTLFTQPHYTQTFVTVIETYTALYIVIGLALLVGVIIRDPLSVVRKQAVVLLIGLVLPIVLLYSLTWVNISFGFEALHTILGHYGFIGVPAAVAIAIIQFELFDIRHTNRSHFYFMLAILAALVGYFILLGLIQSVPVTFNQFFSQDLRVILMTIVLFYVLRPVYRNTRSWIKQQAYGNIEDFRVGLRLFSRELVKAKSYRDLEILISWDLVSDFKLRSAEMVTTKRPTSPYALSLPLQVSNTTLGTLFLGDKINGKDFTSEELDILSELQKQLSLALWSLELDQAIQATEQLTRLKSKFLANVTHELRTPLNSIINYIGFVLDDYKDTLNREQIEHLEQALDSAEQLLQIINNILDMSKIEVGQMTLHPQSTDLLDIVAEVSGMVKHVINNKPIELITEVSPILPNIYADRLRMRQIVLNMLSNAAKFTQEGSICLSAYPDNGNIVIKVADTGIGIDQHTLPTIFEQFVSTGLTDARENFGPGLSMPITKSLVELHGGWVNVESSPGQGTTFTVTLPVNSNI